MSAVKVVVGNICDPGIKGPKVFTMLGFANAEGLDHREILRRYPTAFEYLKKVDAKTPSLSSCVQVICQGDNQELLFIRPQFCSEHENGKIDRFIRGYSVHTVISLEWAWQKKYREIVLLGGDSLRKKKGMQLEDYLEVAHGIAFFISDPTHINAQMNFLMVVSHRLQNAGTIADQCIKILQDKGCEVVTSNGVIASIGTNGDRGELLSRRNAS